MFKAARCTEAAGVLDLRYNLIISVFIYSFFIGAVVVALMVKVEVSTSSEAKKSEKRQVKVQVSSAEFGAHSSGHHLRSTRHLCPYNIPYDN